MRVYHLLRAEHALDDLKRRRLKVARFADLNDPFELLALELPDSGARHAYNRWRTEAAEKFGLLCFGRTWRNPVMWSHYAENHRGACLGFDVPDTRVRRVAYLKNRVSFQRLVPPALDTATDPGPLFHTKFEGWAYEREWRRVVRLNETQKEGDLHFWPFGGDLHLREIIVGARCEFIGDEFREALGPTDEVVTFLQARPAFRSFGVVIQRQGFRRRSVRGRGERHGPRTPGR